MTVKSFKLISGEEVVATVVTTLNPTGYTLRKPHILQFQQVAPGQLGLAFIPWTLSNPDIDTVEIPTSAVISVFEPAAKVEKQYLEQTSGISLVSSI